MRPADTDPPEVQDQLWAGFGGDLAFEVGAYLGLTIPFLGTRFRRVVSFEPLPAVFRQAAASFPDADIRQVAISGHDGTVELVLKNDHLTTLTHELWERESPEGQERVTFPARSLDSLAAEIGMPDFADVDVEGHELEVLHGAGTLLAAGTAWLIEFHSQPLHGSCLAVLEAAGYRVETVRHPHYEPESRLWHSHGWMRALRA